MHLLKQHFLSQFSSCDPPISLMSSEEDGERIFHFFLFFLGPFSAHSSPLPQGGACQHPSGLNLPLVQILSLVCSPKLLRDQREGWVWSLIYGIWSAVETREVFQLNSCERFHFMVHIAHKNPVVALAKGRLQVIVKRRYCKGSFYECKCCPLLVWMNHFPWFPVHHLVPPRVTWPDEGRFF